MHFNKYTIIVSSVLFVMLMIIWLPSFSNLGELIVLAKKESFFGISITSIFLAEVVVSLAVWRILLSYRRLNSKEITLTHAKRHLILNLWYLGQILVVFLAAGFLVHQDASWYQLAHESNEIIPAQVLILIVCYPGYIFFGGGAYLYAKTRLPEFLKDKEAAFVILTFAPFVYLPYYDVRTNLSVMDEPTYIIAYWLISISWLLMGVAYLVFKSIMEIIMCFRSIEASLDKPNESSL